MFFVAYYPEVQETLREEILTRLGTTADADAVVVVLEDMERTPFTEAFLLEVQRLRPIAPLCLPRLTTQDCDIGGIKIPKV